MIEKGYKRLSPLCFLPCGKLVCYKDGNLVVMNNEVIEKRYSIFHTKKEKIVAKSHFLYRGLRLGIRATVALSDELIVFSIGNILYEYNLKEEKLSEGFCLIDRIRPLTFTEVKGVEGFDDMLIFGGYQGNPEKKPVNIYRRVELDKWEIVHVFSQGTINHVHNIIPDPYRNCLWIYTGDFDEAAAIWKATDNFKSVERVVCNDQKYRGCVAFALPEGLLYATDSPLAYDYIYLLNPDTLETKEIMPIEGSCIYGCKWKDKYIFESTVEPSGIYRNKLDFLFCWKKGPGIKDRYVRIYCGNLESGFKVIYKEKKDWLPFVFQFGVFKFPVGKNESDSLYFQPVATDKNDLNLMIYKR